MHTHTTVTKIHYKSRDTYRLHITGILCPCFKLFTVQDDRKKSFRLLFCLKASGDAVIGFKLNVWSTKSRHLISAPR